MEIKNIHMIMLRDVNVTMEMYISLTEIKLMIQDLEVNIIYPQLLN